MNGLFDANVVLVGPSFEKELEDIFSEGSAKIMPEENPTPPKEEPKLPKPEPKPIHPV
jgi:hypothetical protein